MHSYRTDAGYSQVFLIHASTHKSFLISDLRVTRRYSESQVPQWALLLASVSQVNRECS